MKFYLLLIFIFFIWQVFWKVYNFLPNVSLMDFDMINNSLKIDIYNFIRKFLGRFYTQCLWLRFLFNSHSHIFMEWKMSFKELQRPVCVVFVRNSRRHQGVFIEIEIMFQKIPSFVFSLFPLYFPIFIPMTYLINGRFLVYKV